MILGDSEIRQRVTQSGLVQPFSNAYLQPASYDISLAGPYLFPQPYGIVQFDNNIPEYMVKHGHLSLPPGGFALGSTMENVTLPLDICAQTDQCCGPIDWEFRPFRDKERERLRRYLLAECPWIENVREFWKRYRSRG